MTDRRGWGGEQWARGEAQADGSPLAHALPELHPTPTQCALAAAMLPSSAVAMAAVSMASWSVTTRQTALMAPTRPPVKNVSWGQEKW